MIRFPSQWRAVFLCFMVLAMISCADDDSVSIPISDNNSADTPTPVNKQMTPPFALTVKHYETGSTPTPLSDNDAIAQVGSGIHKDTLLVSTGNGTDWSFSGAPDWVTLRKITGQPSAEDTLEISYNANPDANPRNAVITISATGPPATALRIQISQSENACPDASPVPLISYSSEVKTLFDSMRVAIRAKNLRELKRLISCSAERANTTADATYSPFQVPILIWLSADSTDPDFDFSVKAAEVLIDNGADIEKGLLIIGGTPLESAARSNNLPLVKFLVSKGAKAKSKAMVDAAGEGHLGVVKFLLANGAKAKSVAMVDAVLGGHLEVVKFLLSEGADIFIKAAVFIDNVLQLAASYGHLDLVKFLVEEDKRLDINATSTEGSAFTLAARRGHVEVVKYLLDKGVDINQGSKTALQRASYRGQLAVVKELIRRGADVNKADMFGLTPLMSAVLSDQNGLEIVKALVEQGKADLTKKDKDGETALAVARNHQARTASSKKAYIQTMIDYLVSKCAPE